MEFPYSVQQLLLPWLLPGSVDTVLLNGNNLSQRVVMNFQLQQVIDSMGVASALVRSVLFSLFRLKACSSQSLPSPNYQRMGTDCMSNFIWTDVWVSWKWESRNFLSGTTLALWKRSTRFLFLIFMSMSRFRGAAMAKISLRKCCSTSKLKLRSLHMTGLPLNLEGFWQNITIWRILCLKTTIMSSLTIISWRAQHLPWAFSKHSGSHLRLKWEQISTKENNPTHFLKLTKHLLKCKYIHNSQCFNNKFHNSYTLPWISRKHNPWTRTEDSEEYSQLLEDKLCTPDNNNLSPLSNL